MRDFEAPGTTLDEPARRRSTGSLFGDLGERLARTFGTADRSRSELPSFDQPESYGQETVAWDQPPARFPVSRVGYEPTAVDQHLAELEREVGELRVYANRGQQNVAAEIERIGAQTASILKVAHEQAQDITREAQRQADECVSQATARANAVTEEANVKLRQIDSETDAIWQERARLIEDARTVASSLLKLAEDATERFPGEPERRMAAASPSPIGEPTAAPTPAPVASPAPVESLPPTPAY